MNNSIFALRATLGDSARIAPRARLQHPRAPAVGSRVAERARPPPADRRLHVRAVTATRRSAARRSAGRAMTIAFKKRKRHGRATRRTLRQAMADTEVARLLILSLPPDYRIHPTDAKR